MAGDALPTTGLRSITVRRICLVLMLVGVTVSLAYDHDSERVLTWYVAMAGYGIVVAGAIQHVYRDVRVGRLETAAMLLSTVTFVGALLVAPEQIGAIHGATTTLVRVPDSPNPIPSTHGFSTPTFNSPLLRLFGHRTSTSTSPWLTVAYVVAGVAMVAICAQWVLVARLGRHRGGVFDPIIGAGGLATFATLDEPLGTGVTRPAAVARPARNHRTRR